MNKLTWGNSRKELKSNWKIEGRKSEESKMKKDISNVSKESMSWIASKKISLKK